MTEGGYTESEKKLAKRLKKIYIDEIGTAPKHRALLAIVRKYAAETAGMGGPGGAKAEVKAAYIFDRENP